MSGWVWVCKCVLPPLAQGGVLQGGILLLLLLLLLLHLLQHGSGGNGRGAALGRREDVVRAERGRLHRQRSRRYGGRQGARDRDAAGLAGPHGVCGG